MELVRRILAQKSFQDAEGNTHRLHSAVSLDEVERIIELCKSANAKKTLEVGMAYGTSAMAFSLAHKELGNTRGLHHYAIDPFQKTQWKGLGLWNVKQVGYASHVKLLEMPSAQALPKLVETHAGSFDVILIDGWHTFDATLLDAIYSVTLLRKGGYLIIDDMWMPSIKQVARYLETNYRHLKKLAQGTSIVFQKIGADARDWNFHVKF
jgi:predicted O-methyltransferase YrrM